MTLPDVRTFTKDELVALLKSDIAGWSKLYREAIEAGMRVAVLGDVRAVARGVVSSLTINHEQEGPA